MVSLPDWLFLIFILLFLLQTILYLYASFQSDRVAKQLSTIVGRLHQLFSSAEQVGHFGNQGEPERHQFGGTGRVPPV